MARRIRTSSEPVQQTSKATVFGAGTPPTVEMSKDFGLNRFATRHKRADNVFNAFTAQSKKKKELDGEEFIKYLAKEYDGYEVKVADLQVSHQVQSIAMGEYIRKPYSQSTLVELAELSQMLKSCIIAVASNSVRLGLELNPLGYPHVGLSTLSDEDTELFHTQSLLLIRWLDRITQGTDLTFVDLCYQVVLSLKTVGEAFIEVLEDAKGNITELRFAAPEYIWVGRDKDRYVQAYRGKKTYFKMFNDLEMRRASDFKTPEEAKAPIIPEDQATKLIHLREPNMMSQTYGIPEWTPSVEGILGNRACDERDKVFFDNDATPRMAVVVSGGVLTEDTLNRMESYFKQTQGISNTGRVLVLEVSSANSNSPSWKPPKVELKPLTVGKTEDASFLKYRNYNNEMIREAFRIANIFLGTAGDVNRAAAFTLREMSVNLVFSVVGSTLSSLLNRTILKSWMAEEHLTDENCFVQIGFKIPDTMSQKDRAEIMKMLASAGAYSPNDIRAEQGLDRWEASWANIPTALAIVFAQMGLIQTPSADELTEGMDLESDGAIPDAGGTDTGKTRQALFMVRHFLERAFEGVDHSAGETMLAGIAGDLHSLGSGLREDG